MGQAHVQGTRPWVLCNKKLQFVLLQAQVEEIEFVFLQFLRNREKKQY